MFNESELDRLHVIREAVNGHCTVSLAAQRLRLSPRRIQQLKKEFQQNGVCALIHGNANRPSHRRLDPVVAEEILRLRKLPPYCHANFLHFQELLEERHHIVISYSALYRLLTQNGFASPKTHRSSPKKTLHPTRERKPAAGVMLQVDATPFNWFGGSEKFSLHGFIDDATGKVTGLYLCKNECLLGYLEAFRQTLMNFGTPQSLYSDRGSVFFVNPKKQLDLSIEEQLLGHDTKLTQFGHILEHLGVVPIAANSPQAKGRVERLWGTLLSRLPVELALAGIQDMEQANAFLQDYIPKFNQQFSVKPRVDWSAFLPVPDTLNLDRLLCMSFSRVLSRGSTVSISSHIFRIEQDRFHAGTKVTVLLSEKNGLQALINGLIFPIVPLDNLGGSESVVRTGELPSTVRLLILLFLLKDAKAA